MEVYWKSAKLKSQLENEAHLIREYDIKVAQSVAKRMKEIVSFPSYADLPPNANKHSIKNGNRLLYYAVDLPSLGSGRGKLRLTFEPYGEYDLANQKTVVSIKITGIEDYHH